MVLMLLFAIGVLAGLASAFVGRRSGRRPFPDAVVAILGALLGGYGVADALGHESSHPGDIDAVVLLAAALSAVALLALARLAVGAARLGRAQRRGH
jgi:uncharacterized membrane protein YeaQ/YmgE (transglycosylase-associated protein family)